MYKWNMGIGSVEIIDDPLTRQLSENRTADDPDWNPKVSTELEAKFEELESHMTAEDIFKVPKTAVLQLQVNKF